MCPNANAADTRILVVDDETAARTALVDLLRAEGYEVGSAADGFKALGRAEQRAPDILLTDLKMAGMDGLELIAKMREKYPDVSAIVMTAYGTVSSAVDAMRLGAEDYITKPIDLDALLLLLERVQNGRALRAENARLRHLINERDNDSQVQLGLVGRSPAFRELMQLVVQVADSDASVLISGECGTGKEVIASALHRHSPRRNRAFVALHCAALSEAVIESEMFGHEEGAFPGATARREGRIKQADGGTLFLDEVGDIPAAAQVRLLRFLQEHRFERVGGTETLTSDVRVIAATHRDLAAEVASGRFREDLYYRLNVITLRTPTLRQRREDIPLLASHFLTRYAAKNHKTVLGFRDRTLQILVNSEWPGNVRQLENCIERAVVLCPGREIEPRHLPPDILRPAHTGDELPPVPGASLAEMERYMILRTLEHVGGSTSKASEILGISPRKIQYRMSEYRREQQQQT
ncbi:MAG: sigma-54-dependent Fis family transcriptional regulator [Myxococcales bacterium FL481]|nr:MAG: sigma-54-dependent Fis family transcriptional regulator [Myxococcales bacterium FL481]